MTNRKRCTFTPDHLGDVRAGGHGNLLDGRALGAEHDLPLALALDIDRLLDADAAVLQLLPVGGLDRQSVGELLVQPQEQLLAGDLGGGLAQRSVGQLVLGEEPGPGRHGFGEIGSEIDQRRRRSAPRP